MGKLKVIRATIEYIDFVPCIKCGSEDINFYNCGYTAFNTAGAKCRNCGNKVVDVKAPANAQNHYMVPVWNEENDPNLLRAKYLAQIKDIQNLINALPK